MHVSMSYFPRTSFDNIVYNGSLVAPDKIHKHVLTWEGVCYVIIFKKINVSMQEVKIMVAD